MKSLLSFLVLCLVLTLLGCGNVFIRGALPASSSTVSGSVSVVQLSAVIGENGTTGRGRRNFSTGVGGQVEDVEEVAVEGEAVAFERTARAGKWYAVQ